MSFTNKSVLVTGSASGLGKAIATAFAQAGAHVTLCDVNKSRLDTTLAELRAGNPTGTMAAVEVDIRSEESLGRAFDAAKSAGNNRLDVLINNAGVMDAIEPAGEVSRDMWDRVIGINLTGTYVASKLAINTMLSQSPAGGQILNVSSVGGMKGGVAGAAYTASKHAVLGLTKNTAAFYAKQGIRCNAILPGGMETNLEESVPNARTGGIKQENYAMIMSSMAMQPGMCALEDVSKLVLAICGEQGTLLNGACIPADHGWIAY